MQELLQAALIPTTFPFTVLLGITFLYWLTVFAGLISLDTFDIDLEADADFDVGVDADADVDFDADADVDLDGDGDVDGDAGTNVAAASGGGFLIGLARFFYLGEIPIMVFMSFFSLFSWVLSVLYQENFGSVLLLGPLNFLMMIPIAIGGSFAAKFACFPFRKLFKSLKSDESGHIDLTGKLCTVTSTQVTSSFGQAEIESDGSPVILRVVTDKDIVMKKGQKAVLIKELDDRHTFLITPFEE